MKPAQLSGNAAHQEISKHLEYELRMLVHSASKCEQTPAAADSRVYLESFLLHARNLIAFLYDRESSNSTHDDVLAEHFCPDAAAWRAAMRPSAVLEETKVRAHKYLAHITYTREVPQGWEVQAIARELSASLEVFLRHAKLEWLADEVWRSAAELRVIVTSLATFSSTMSITGGPSGSAFRPL
jgi:hypothetical protein